MSILNVWVAYASPEQQLHIAVPYVAGMTVEDVIQHSGIRHQVELVEPLSLGIFGLKIDHMQQLVQPGDRIEIYRPLTVNPKDIRRLRAQKNPVGRYQRSHRLQKLL